MVHKRLSAKTSSQAARGSEAVASPGERSSGTNADSVVHGLDTALNPEQPLGTTEIANPGPGQQGFDQSPIPIKVISH